MLGRWPDLDHRREALHRVVADLAVEAGVDGQRPRGAEQQRLAVGRRRAPRIRRRCCRRRRRGSPPPSAGRAGLSSPPRACAPSRRSGRRAGTGTTSVIGLVGKVVGVGGGQQRQGRGAGEQQSGRVCSWCCLRSSCAMGVRLRQVVDGGVGGRAVQPAGIGVGRQRVARQHAVQQHQLRPCACAAPSRCAPPSQAIAIALQQW